MRLIRHGRQSPNQRSTPLSQIGVKQVPRILLGDPMRTKRWNSDLKRLLFRTPSSTGAGNFFAPLNKRFLGFISE